jgi:hypothetical protein
MDSKKYIKLPIAIAAGAALAISSAHLSNWFFATDKPLQHQPPAIASNLESRTISVAPKKSPSKSLEDEPGRFVADHNVVPVDHPQATDNVTTPAALKNLEYVDLNVADADDLKSPALPTRTPNQVEETTPVSNANDVAAIPTTPRRFPSPIKFPTRDVGWPPTNTNPVITNNPVNTSNTEPLVPSIQTVTAPQPKQDDSHANSADSPDSTQEETSSSQADTPNQADNTEQLNELARQIALLREQLNRKQQPIDSDLADSPTKLQPETTPANELKDSEPTVPAKTTPLETTPLETTSPETTPPETEAKDEGAPSNPSADSELTEKALLESSELRKNDPEQVAQGDLTLERDNWLEDDSWKEKAPEVRELAQPYAARPGALNYHALNAISKEAEVHNQRAINLASRAAYYSARAEFLESLKTVARGLDLQRGNRTHSLALSHAFRAIKEADHFAPQSGSIDREDSIQFFVDSHRTPVLHNMKLNGMLPSLAIQAYYNYAEEQIKIACRGMPVASQSLYGLGRIYSELSEHPGQVVTIRATVTFKALLFHKSALTVQPSHFQAANELGVLLCRRGQLQAAHAALSHSLAISPQPETWHNMTVVQNRMREVQVPAHQQFRNNPAAPYRAPQYSPQPRANGGTAIGQTAPNTAPGSQPPVQFVTVQQFQHGQHRQPGQGAYAPQTQPRYPTHPNPTHPNSTHPNSTHPNPTRTNATQPNPSMNYPYNRQPQASPPYNGLPQYMVRPIPAAQHPMNQPASAWWQFWKR